MYFLEKMKNNKDEKEDAELLKTVAQAWLGHSGNPSPTREYEAQRSRHRCRPTRFKLEAMKAAAREDRPRWDFGQSLWDSYEIVTLCKKLEAGAALDQPLELGRSAGKRRRESKNSLRSLFNRISSKRFDMSIPEADESSCDS